MTTPTRDPKNDRVLRAAARLAVNAAELQGKEPDARAKRILESPSSTPSAAAADSMTEALGSLPLVISSPGMAKAARQFKLAMDDAFRHLPDPDQMSFPDIEASSTQSPSS